MSTSDGSTADYYELPAGATELQHLISHRDMNAQIGEIFRACYRYGIASHSSRMRDAKKIRFYIEAEIARLEALELATQPAFDWSGALAAQEADNSAHLAAVMGFDPARGDESTRVAAACGARAAEARFTAAVPGADRGKVSIQFGAQPTSPEPAVQIDDESDRQQAVAQNGNDGAVYDDPWYGAPKWARFKAQDEDGRTHFYQDRPKPGRVHWVVEDGDFEEADVLPPRNPNWRDTLIERTSGQDPRE